MTIYDAETSMASTGLRQDAAQAIKLLPNLLPPRLAQIVTNEMRFWSGSSWGGNHARLREAIAEIDELARKYGGEP